MGDQGSAAATKMDDNTGANGLIDGDGGAEAPAGLRAYAGQTGGGGDGGGADDGPASISALDDAATDAGASSLPPSEEALPPMGGGVGGAGRAQFDTVGSDGGGLSSLGAGGIIGPPSPLTGCYLLIILGEPHSEEHKDNILQHLLKGFLSWDVADCHVDLEEELMTITQHAPEGEEARNGERLIQYASENLVTEVLIHPQYNTLIQCMRNLLSSFTRHRHIIHAGYTFTGNGSWILQDGTFSVADFSEAFQEHDVQRVIRAYSDTITMNIHCADAGLWHTLPEKSFARLCKIRINPVDVLDTGSESINSFIDFLAPLLVPTSLRDLLETSEVVGNIRFTHPTLYVFPGGQGDAALFGINGFNMLVDGGFNRKACFWDFARHLDRLDAVLMTRLNNSNIQGLSSVASRKHDSHVYPQIGHFFCNIPDRKGGLPSPDGDKDRNPLLVDLFERGHNLISDLKSIDLKPQICYRNPEPINLYHKVGHGTLDMYVISPARDSKEVKDFMQKWNAGDQRLFAARDSRDFNFPLHNLVSICALLVWQPANPDDTITRILFPGSTPDYKIQEGLEKLKHLEFMKHSTCTAKSIAPAIQPVATTRKTLKATAIASEIVTHSKLGRFAPTPAAAQPDNKIKEETIETAASAAEEKIFLKKKEDSIDTDEQAAETGDETAADAVSRDGDKIDGDTADEEIVTQEVKKVEVVIVKPQLQSDASKELIEVPGEISKPSKAAKSKVEKPRAEVKPLIRSRIDTKPPKSMDRKGVKKDLSTEKKSSPTATPRKDAPKAPVREAKPKVITRAIKSSPTSTPAKSAKEANNRKVLESKQQTTRQSTVSAASATVSRRELSSRTTTSTATGSTAEKKDQRSAAQQTRKPISRRPRGASPTKRAPGSPIKSAKPKADLKKSRIDKDGTTDSSLVSTPSADDAAKKIHDLTASQELDAEKQRELDDLKEEQEVVREIEAVFSRDELKRQKQIKAELREMAKQDSTTEAEEEEEYLIIEKEEIEQYTEDSIVEQESSMTKEEEIQKHQRDSQESEKKRKKSAEEEIEVEIAKTEAEMRKSRGEPDVGHTQFMAERSAHITTSEKSEIKAEVQDIITTAKDIVSTRADDAAGKTEEELSSSTPEDKISSAKKTSDTKDDLNDIAPGVVPANLQESLPEEKFSATIESGATTAPTLPEDERIPLDKIKEDLIIEEKHSSKELGVTSTLAASMSAAKSSPIIKNVPLENIAQDVVVGVTTVEQRVLPTKMTFGAHQNLLRDVIKTPDEVADLPMHEVADFEVYEKDTQDSGKMISLKEETAKEEKEIEEKEKDEEKSDKQEIKLEDVTEHVVAQVKEITKADIKVEAPLGAELVSKVAKTLKEVDTKDAAHTPDDKETSDITSEDELPVQTTTSTVPAKVKDKEDTASAESPATIEEAIVIDVQEKEKHISDKEPISDAMTGEKETGVKEDDEMPSSPVGAKSPVKSKEDEEATVEKSAQSSKQPSVAGSVKDEKSPAPSGVPSQEISRHPSIAESIKDDAEKASILKEEVASTLLKDDEADDKASIGVSKEPSVAGSVKDEKSPAPSAGPSQEISRHPSIAESVKDEAQKASILKEEVASTLSKEDEAHNQSISIDVSKEKSPAESVKDEKSPKDSKEPSVAGSGKDEKSPAQSAGPSQEISRHPSIAEIIQEEADKAKTLKEEVASTILKDDEADDKKSIGVSKEPSVAGSVKDEKSPIPSAAPSQEISRHPSIAESVKDEAQKASILKEEVASTLLKDDEADDKKSIDISKEPSPAGRVKDEKTPVASKEPSVAGSVKDEKSPTPSAAPSQEISRHSSIAESIKDDAEKVSTVKEEVASTLLKDHEADDKKSIDVAKEPSPAGSMKDEKSPMPSKEPSVAGSVKDEKSPTPSAGPSQEISRHPSIAESFKDETEKASTLKEEVASTLLKDDEADVKKSIDVSKELSAAGSVIDEKSPIASKEPSVAGSVKDEKSPVASKEPSVAGSVKDEKSPAPSAGPSQEISRHPSIAEIIKEGADKATTLKEEVASSLLKNDVADDKKSIDVSKEPSPAGSVKDEKTPIPSKEPSVAGSVKDEKSAAPSPSPSQEISRRTSIAESIKDETDKATTLKGEDASTLLKDDEADDKKSIDLSKEPSPAGSVKDDKTPVASKEPSVAGSVKDEKSPAPSAAPSQEISRHSSIAESIKDETEKASTLKEEVVSTLLKDDEAVVKKSIDVSKELSAAGSVIDDKSPIASKEPSVAGSVKDEKSPAPSAGPSQEISRHPSIAEIIQEEADKAKTLKEEVASTLLKDDVADDRKSIDVSKEPSPAGSVKDDKTPVASKEPSVAGSVKDEKSPMASKEPSVAGSVKDEKSPTPSAGPSQEISRHPSIAESFKDETEKASTLKEEVASTLLKDDETDDKKSIDMSREPSPAGSVKDEKTPIASKEPSVAGSVKDEKSPVASKEPSVAGSVKDEKSPAPSQEISRHPSIAESVKDEADKASTVKEEVASTLLKDDEADDKKSIDVSKELSPAGSVIDEKSPIASKEPSVADSVKDEKSPIASKETSVAGSVKDEKSPAPSAGPSQEISRHPSIAEIILEGAVKSTTLKEEVASTLLKDDEADDKKSIDISKEPSPAGSVKDETTIIASKEPSVTGSIKDEKSPVASKDPSVAGSVKDEKSPAPSQEISRHPSIAEIIEEGADKATTLKEEVASSLLKDDVAYDKKSIDVSKEPSLADGVKDEKTPIPSKEPSVAGSVKDEKSAAPSPSPSQEISRRTSIAESVKDEADQASTLKEEDASTLLKDDEADDKKSIDLSKEPSPAGSVKDDKTPVASKEPSVAGSVKDEKSPAPSAGPSQEISRHPSIAEIILEGAVKSTTLKEEVASSLLKDDEADDKKSIDISKELSPARSVKDETTIIASKEPSVAGSIKDEKSPVPSKEPSVAGSVKDEKSPAPSAAPSQDISRHPSIAESVKDETEKASTLKEEVASTLLKDDEVDDKKSIDLSKEPSPAGSVKDEKTPITSKEPSVAGSVKDEKSPVPSAAPSQDISRHPSIAESVKDETEKASTLKEEVASTLLKDDEVDDKKSIDLSKEPSPAGSVKDDKTPVASKEPSVAGSVKDEKSPVPSAAPSQDISRHPSIAESVKDETEKASTLKEEVASTLLKDDEVDDKKSIDLSKEPSPAGSVKDDKTPVASKEPSVAGSVKDEKSPAPSAALSQDISRHPSIAESVKDETEKASTLKEEVASTLLKDDEADDKKSIDGSREPSPAGSVKDEKTPITSKEPSVAGSVKDEKSPVASKEPSVAGSVKDEKSPAPSAGPSQEISRHPSIAEIIKEEADKATTLKEEVASTLLKDDEADDKKSIDASKDASVEGSVKDKKSPVASKEPSGAGSLKDEKSAAPSPSPSHEISRHPSIAESVKDEADQASTLKEGDASTLLKDDEADDKKSIDVSKDPSVEGSVKDEKSPIAPKEPSVAGSVKDEKSPMASKEPSVAGSVKDEKSPMASMEPSITGSVKDEKSPAPSAGPSQEISRHPSIADSVKDEADKATTLKEVVASTLLKDDEADDKKSIDVSKDPSVEGSVKDEKSPIAPKKPSVAGSVKDEKSPMASKEPSVAGSVKNEKSPIASKEPSVAGSVKDEMSPMASKEPSVAGSVKDEKSPMASKEPSVAGSVKDDKSPMASKEPSVAGSVKDEKSPMASKEPSEAGSVEDEKSPMASKEPSVAGSVKDEKSPMASKEPSVAGSVKDEKSPMASKEPSVAGSVKDEKSPMASKEPSVAGSVKDEKSPIASKEPSVAGSVKDEMSPMASKEPSVAGSVKDEKSPMASKEPSVAGSVKDEKSPMASKEPSVAGSVKDEKSPIASKEPSVAGSVKDEKSPMASKEPSVAGSVKDEKSPMASKEPSVAGSVKDEKSPMASKEPSEAGSVEDEKSPMASKEPSVAGSVKDEKSPIASKEPSVAGSVKDEKSPMASKEPSVAGSVKDEKSPMASKEPSVAGSVKDEKSPMASKEPSVAGSVKDESSPAPFEEISKHTSIVTSIAEISASEKSKTSLQIETDSTKSHEETTVSSPLDVAPQMFTEDDIASKSQRELLNLDLNLQGHKSELPTKSSPVDVAVGDFGDVHQLKSHPSSTTPAEHSKAAAIDTVSSPVDSGETEKFVIMKEEQTQFAKCTDYSPQSQITCSSPVDVAESSSKVVIMKEEQTQFAKCTDYSPQSQNTSSGPVDVAETSSKAAAMDTVSSPVDSGETEKFAIMKEEHTQFAKCTDYSIQYEITSSSPVDIAESSSFFGPETDPVKHTEITGDASETKISDSDSFLEDVKSMTKELTDSCSKLETMKQEIISKTEQTTSDLLSTRSQTTEHAKSLVSEHFPVELREEIEEKSTTVLEDSKSVKTSFPCEGCEKTETLKEAVSEIEAATEVVKGELVKAGSVVSETIVSTTKDLITELEESSKSIVEVTKTEFQSLSQEVVKAIDVIDILKSGKTVHEQDEKEQDVHPFETLSEEIQKESAELSSFPTELRETHITTLESPDFKVSICDRDETILHDIKEEDEEHRFSPPTEKSPTSSEQPMRPVSPREVEVAKIVLDVAKVLKSEKDITEIIPDFDEKQLEEKIKTTVDPDPATVQRMLVTATSEDGGEETEICTKGTIHFAFATPSQTKPGDISSISEIDQKAEVESEKSSPDLKSGPISLEEKDKIEESEKAQMKLTGLKDQQGGAEQSEDSVGKGEDSQVEVSDKSPLSAEGQKDDPSRTPPKEVAHIQSDDGSSESIVSEIQMAALHGESTKDTASIPSTSKDCIKQTVAEFLANEKCISTKELSMMTKASEDAGHESIASSSTSRRASDLAASTKDEARRESALSFTSEERQTHSDQEDDDDDDDDLANVKEGRSKSIATIMMTSIYKPSEDIDSAETIHEELREAESYEEIIQKTVSQTAFASTTTTTETQFVSSTETVAADRKTPPTAPVSPGIKSIPTATTTNISAPTATDASAVTSTTTTGPLSPKDTSGKSSPGGFTSESQSIPTPIGRESLSDSPDASPKPTSPFPRVSNDELKTSGPETTPKAVALPAEEELPELREFVASLRSTELGGSTEKIITTTITTVTKVISTDGKEVVTEETVTTTDSSEPHGEKVTVTTTRTTSESDKSEPILPKEVAMLRGSYRSGTPGSDDGAGAYLSDDDMPNSPRSVSSHGIGDYELQRSSSGVSKRSDFDIDESQDDIPPQYGSEEHSTARPISTKYLASDPMSTSYYGALPPDSFDAKSSDPIPIQGTSAHVMFSQTFTDSPISQSTESVESTSQTWAAQRKDKGDHKFLDEADMDFEKALKEHVEVRGADVMSSVTAKYSYSPSKAEAVEKAVAGVEKPTFPLSDVQKVKAGETAAAPGLSSGAAKDGQETGPGSGPGATGSKSTEAAAKDWGKPLGLPAPLPIEGDIRTTPKKERRLVATKTRLNNEKNLRKRSESPNKARKPSPVYVDLTYVPHNGNSYYSHVEFFKRVRARYYVFSGIEPSRQVYDALLEAKQTWEEKELEVTIIPTYDTDVLGYWVAENEELLAKHHIDLSPSASRCTINLQDHETSCAAYRLEF